MFVDGDGWSVADILTHDARLLDADGQAKFFTGISKPVYQSLKTLCGVKRKCSIIGKDKFTNEDFTDLALSFKRARLKRLSSYQVWM